MKYLKNVSPFQAGCKADRSAADNTFLLRGCIDHAVYIGQPVYLVLYDYKQCFDSLWLDESLLSLWRVGIQDRMFAMLYQLNRNSDVTVKTSVGTTATFNVKKLVKQRTISGTCLCSTSTGEYPVFNNESGIIIQDLKIGPLAFIDDLIDINTSIGDVYKAYKKAAQFARLKKSVFNADNCEGLVVNCSHGAPVQELFLDGQELLVKSFVRYLGDLCNEN